MKKLKRMLWWLPDKPYLQLYYFLRFKRLCNFKNPETYNEKMQWLKLHDRKPVYTELVDKYDVRKHIADAIGEEHLIPLVGGPWNSFDEIDFDALPEQFVLKCTHDCESVIICRDKSKLDIAAAKKKIGKCMKNNYYWISREWPYKNAKGKIIAEAYMEDENAASGLTDYKFFCFDGKPKLLYVSQGLEDHQTARISFFDLEGNAMPFRRRDYQPLDEALKLPENYAQLKETAELLAKKIDRPFIRIDLYSIKGKMYFSEITFFPCGGLLPFEPESWDRELGNWIDLKK